ncbi:hypothetical protein [Galenea microaerophila]
MQRKYQNVWLIVCMSWVISGWFTLAYAETNVEAHAQALAPAKVHFSRTQLKMGEFTTLYIRGAQIEQAFTPAIVKQLKQYWMIFKVEGDEDFVRVTLYPQKPGQFTFPAIDAGRIQLPPQVFHIAPNPEVQVSWQPDSTKLFAHQTLNWKVMVHLSDPAYRGTLHLFEAQKIESSPNTYQVDHSDYRALSHGTAIAERKTKNQGVEQLFMAAYTFKQAGVIRAVNPYLEVQNRSQQPWHFFPYPDRHHLFHVKPLPSYLPFNLPVGRLALKAEALPLWIESGDLVNWAITLKGISVPADSLPSLEDQLVADTQVQWLANQIQKSEQLTAQGLVSQAKIDQPLRFLSWGQHVLPELRLLSFNPATEKVQTTVLPAQTVWVWPAGAKLIMQLLIFLLGITLLSFSIWGLTLQQQYKRWLARTQRAETPEALWCALQNCMHWMLDQPEVACDGEKKQIGAPVQQTFEAYMFKLGRKGALPLWVETLNQQLFSEQGSRNEEDFQVLKQQALKWCQQQTVWQKIRYQLMQTLPRIALWRKRG